MTKREFKGRLQVLNLSQADFFRIAKTSQRVTTNYKDDDDMPDIYDAFLGMLEELHTLKNANFLYGHNLPPLEYLKDINKKISGYLNMADEGADG